MGERYGAEPVAYEDHEQAVDALMGATAGRGPDTVIDAVGLEAHGNPGTALVQNVVGSLPSALGKPLMTRAGVDRLSALQLAIDAVRRGGTLSVVGVYGGNADPMPMLRIFDKQLTLRFGQANVHRWFDDILPLAEDDDDPLGLDDFATHRGTLEDASKLYDLFKSKGEGCVKVVLRP
jgi:threonine dehydrogenase-like Zn-dependent dehydrogenase